MPRARALRSAPPKFATGEAKTEQPANCRSARTISDFLTTRRPETTAWRFFILMRRGHSGQGTMRRSPMAVAVFFSGFLSCALAQEEERIPDIPALELPTWERSVNVKARTGYKDNVTLANA